MSKKENAQAPAVAAAGNKGGMCLAEGCNHSIQQADFCRKHFLWFKIGLITKHGTRAKDFDKKYQQHRHVAEASV